VLGVEAAWQQRLSFLPGALSGLGIMANYTFTSSNAQLQEIDRKVELPAADPPCGECGADLRLGRRSRAHSP
jgi:hypothetical protein